LTYKKGEGLPQLVKGGKYVFGWAVVDNRGSMRIPDEAKDEYGFKNHDRIYVLQSSKASKGFAITTRTLLRNSILMKTIMSVPELYNFRRLNGGYIEHKRRMYTWAKIDSKGRFKIGPIVLKKFDVFIGDRLLVVRGSGFALGFIKQGRIVNEALKHRELEEYM
jgi:bifunctional DNA-binding transcriptional regulator/antitoxin component of YhaV-PrlF toxin-antitoxin module